VIADIRQLLAAGPFEPFFFLTRGGNRYPVTSAELAAVDPQRSRAVVWFDDGGSVSISRLHTTAVEKEAAHHA
jgi:hypothetical protein